MTKPPEVFEPPDPPPSMQTTTTVLMGSSLALSAAGIIDLILALTAECLNRLNLALGLIELILGLLILLWILSWWLPRRRRILRTYENQLDTYRESLLEREQSLTGRGTAAETGGGTGESPV